MNKFFASIAATLVISAVAHAATLEIKPQAEITGSEIRVGDILVSSVDVPRQVLEMSLGVAPAPGQERVIYKTVLQNALRNWTSGGEIQWQGAAQCKVVRLGKTVSIDEVRANLESALQHRAGKAGKAKVTDFSDDKSFLVPLGNATIEVELSPNVMESEWSNAMIRFNQGNQTLAAKSVRFRWSLETEVWKANKALRVGDPIRAEDFSPFFCNVFDMNGQVYTGDISSVDAVVSRPLVEGGVLTVQHIKTRTLIKRGTPVIVNYHIGTVHVSMNGTALDSGSRGEVIAVRNDASKKKVFAKITDEGVLEYVQ